MSDTWKIFQIPSCHKNFLEFMAVMKICNSNATKQVIHKRQRRLLVIRGLLYFYVVVYCVHLHLNDSSLLTKGQMRDLTLYFPSACKSVQNDRFLAICYAVCWWSLLVQNYEELTLANSFVSRNKQSYEVSVVAAEGRLFPEWTLWTYPFSVTIFTFSGNSFLVTTKYKIYMLCTPINHAL